MTRTSLIQATILIDPPQFGHTSRSSFVLVISYYLIKDAILYVGVTNIILIATVLAGWSLVRSARILPGREALKRLCAPIKGKLEFTEKAMCPICRDEVTTSTASSCGQCSTLHHRDCWDYNGRCGIYGCGCEEARTNSPLLNGAQDVREVRARPSRTVGFFFPERSFTSRGAFSAPRRWSPSNSTRKRVGREPPIEIGPALLLVVLGETDPPLRENSPPGER